MREVKAEPVDFTLMGGVSRLQKFWTFAMTVNRDVENAELLGDECNFPAWDDQYLEKVLAMEDNIYPTTAPSAGVKGHACEKRQ
jgi:hypothetical protein